MAKPIRIIVHSTADSFVNNQLDRIDNWHKQQAFPRSSLGYYVGYTYVLERDGTLIQTRKDDEEQAHVAGYNQDSIGIGLCLDGDRERPTTQQWLVLKNLINKKMYEWSILPNNIMTHRMFNNRKTCPGKMIGDFELKSLFTPDFSYIESMILRLKQMVADLKSRMGGANKGQNNEIYQ